MRENKSVYQEYLKYCGIENLPKGLEEFFSEYKNEESPILIERTFLEEIYDKYGLSLQQREQFNRAIDAIEQNQQLLEFTQFLIWDLCDARNRSYCDDYQSIIPNCMKDEYKRFYPLLLLIACIQPSMERRKKRGIPEVYYQHIWKQPLDRQMKKYKTTGDVTVSDFPWDINFYTCSIYLLDRFLFIPYRFEDDFTMYRNKSTNEVIALYHPGTTFRRDGQIDGVNNVFDKKETFISIWEENDIEITAHPVNPMGFVEQHTVTIEKEEWNQVLCKGDKVLAIHIPSGPGYSSERLKHSMELALAFYNQYFPEQNVKGFWCESWLLDTRLTLILDEKKSNILDVQQQGYIYPIPSNDEMIKYEVFGDCEITEENCKTSLQKAVMQYMKEGKRFNTLSMIILNDEIEEIGNRPYRSEKDYCLFQKVVDSHLI